MRNFGSFLFWVLPFESKFGPLSIFFLLTRWVSVRFSFRVFETLEALISVALAKTKKKKKSIELFFSNFLFEILMEYFLIKLYLEFDQGI